MPLPRTVSKYSLVSQNNENHIPTQLQVVQEENKKWNRPTSLCRQIFLVQRRLNQETSNRQSTQVSKCHPKMARHWQNQILPTPRGLGMGLCFKKASVSVASTCHARGISCVESVAPISSLEFRVKRHLYMFAVSATDGMMDYISPQEESCNKDCSLRH